MKAPQVVPLSDPEFREIENKLQSFPRQDGYYLTHFASVIELRQQGLSQEDILEALFQAWGEHEARNAYVEAWRQQQAEYWRLHGEPHATNPAQWEVLREESGCWEDQAIPLTDSLEALTSELQGGSAIGHTEETMPPEKATELTSRFAALFESPRAYRGLGWGDPRYVFEQGVLLVDEARAGLLLIIESD